MTNKELKNIDNVSKFSNFQVLNPDFIRCKCNVFYTGKNRNYSIITNEALQKFIERKGYANVPVVGHIKRNKDGKLIMGSHDRKIEISNDSIQEINECSAFGVIPLDCNPRMEKIVNASGIEKEYFTVDIILWSHYFPELMETKYDDEIYFNHSMEINLLDVSYDNDYTVINDFSLQALCMLGKYDNTHGNAEDNSEPCFEDSRIKRFSLNNDLFKKEFSSILDEYNKFKLNVTGENPVNNKLINNTYKKGEMNMDLTKFESLLSDFKYGNNLPKYLILGADESRVFVLDKEDNFKVFAVNYVEADGNVVINWNDKTEGNITYTEKSESEEKSNIAILYSEMEEKLTKQSEEKFSKLLEERINEISHDAEVRYSEIEAKYNDIKNAYVITKEKLEKYELLEREKEKEEHINAVKETLNRFEKKIGNNPAFIYYKANIIDYEKADVEQIEKDLTLMIGDIHMNSKDVNKNYSYNPTSTNVKRVTDDCTSSRYGNLLDGFMN